MGVENMKVVLNVYDIIKYNKYIDCLGVGAYHTGNTCFNEINI